MKKFKIISTPTPVTDLSFKDLYDDFSSEWELKAERLQARRWRKLRNEIA